MINEEERQLELSNAKNVREWLSSQKNRKYHVVRFGVLTERFIPKRRAQRIKLTL